MKRILLIFTLGIVIFCSCSTPKNWQGSVDCNIPRNQMTDAVIQILMEEGFTINPSTGDYITAVSESDLSTSTKIWTGYDSYIKWHIKVLDNKIIATAYFVLSKTNIFGAEVAGSNTTCGEETHEDHKKYWRVRRKLEKLCNNTMIIINTLENSGKENDEFKK